MISDSNKSDPLDFNPAPPQARREHVPIWLLVVMFLMLYWGMVYFDQHSGWFKPEVYSPYHDLAEVEVWQPVTGAPSLAQQGKAVYNKPTCVACHQPDGNGVPGQNPPLTGSEWVNEAAPGRVIRIALNGLNGPINVKGQSFNGTMVPWKDVLSDEEIAAVLTYIRQNKEWGNNAPEVKPEQVKAVRDKIKDRSAPFTPDELQKTPPTD
ncbi:MAG TPA: cytochrome c [Verrucomicrobiae bacterium]|nr:cytochrome c [Verrucomicrobiae bacterium]